MRVTKSIKGDIYKFHVQFIPHERKAKVRYFKSDSWTICELSDDFNHIILPDNKFIFNDTNVEKLKLNKVQRIEALEYNNLHN